MELTDRRRRTLSTALALILALEAVSGVAAAAVRTVPRPASHALPAASPAGEVLAAESGTDSATDGSTAVEGTTPPTSPAFVSRPGTAEPDPARTAAPRPLPARASMPARAAKTVTAPPAAPARATSTAAPARAKAPAAAVRVGRNHLWIPALRIDRAVAWFPCDRARPPDNLVYRWGCAGANNVYLMGHASSVFRPLHDAYVGGRLHVGMKAYYADAKGRVHAYAVAWWKLTRPTADASWAWAAQGRPSMTLQTCVGSNSQYRLIVRLVEVGG
jgi:hypothetical protein